jgi:hypothetical protein
MIAIRTFVFVVWLFAAAVSGTASAAPPPADPAASLDMLSRASDGVEPGLDLAHRQTAGGELLDALATLERLMIAYPEAHKALLDHASLLCRLDDHDGAKVEFDELDRSEFSASSWASATAPCGGSPSDYGWAG